MSTECEGEGDDGQQKRDAAVRGSMGTLGVGRAPILGETEELHVQYLKQKR